MLFDTFKSFNILYFWNKTSICADSLHAKFQLDANLKSPE